VNETSNLTYGTSDPDEVLDAYVPIDGKTSRPAVIVVHGGGWVSGDKSTFASESLALAQAGFSVFDINYFLATPGVPGYPQEGDDVAASIVWVRANAARFGVDPTRIGGLGSSAGANLIALVALQGSGPQTTGSRLMAAVTWSAPVNLAQLASPSCSNPDACILSYLGCTLAACPNTYVAASPVTYIDASDPPMEIFNSSNELVPESQAQELSQDLTAVGVPNTLVIYPGTAHAAAYSALALPPTIAFFQQELYR